MIGVTSAYTLARDGWKVRVFDQRHGAAMEASRGNGRQLSYSYTNALASPAILRQIPALLLGCDPAFRLRPKADGAFLDWGRLFLQGCTASAYRNNTLATLALAQRSRQAMRALLDQHPIEFQHQQNGKFVLVETEKQLAAADQMIQSKRSTGGDQELLTFEEAVEKEPTLAQAEGHFAGAIFSPSDATGNCQAFTEGLLALSFTQFGVEFKGGLEVASVSNFVDGPKITFTNGQSDTADLIVVANAHRARDLVAPMGHKLPIIPMKGYSFTAPAGNAAPKVSITDSRRRIVFTNLGDRVLVAGIAEIGRNTNGVDPARLRSMTKAAQASLPEAAVYSQRDDGWAGFRSMTPNSQPIIRMLEPGIAVNSGHGMLGWTLAMGSAERLADIVRQAR